MPLAQQPSQQHHHLFSAIGSFLHARHPSPHSNTTSSEIAHVSASAHGASELALAHVYQAFESQLAQRLSTLLPAEDTPSVSLASLKLLIGLLLATQTDLRALVPVHHTQSRTRTMEEFLERSIKLLDVCRDIKEQMTEVQSLQGMLQLAMACLSSENTGLSNLRRARKTLALLLLHMEVEREEESAHAHPLRSFRGRLRERLGGNGSRDSSPHRWRSWHGHHRSASSSWHANNASAHGNHPLSHGNHPTQNSFASAPAWHGNHNTLVTAGATTTAHAGSIPGSHAAELFKALHTLELNLLPPKLPPKDEEEYFPAAIYALNVLSVFCLSTLTAAFPSFGKTHSTGSIHPPHSAAWASPFLRLQEKVQEELRGRSRTPGAYAGMWELDQIFFLVKRLLEFMPPDEFPGSDDNKEELQRLVKLFCQHAQELEREMGMLHKQIKEFYDRIIAARMGVLDLLSIVNV